MVGLPVWLVGKRRSRQRSDDPAWDWERSVIRRLSGAVDMRAEKPPPPAHPLHDRVPGKWSATGWMAARARGPLAERVPAHRTPPREWVQRRPIAVMDPLLAPVDPQ